ncbi:MAG: histidine phosphatase family protein [Burkholderiales bacterium]
MNWAVWRHPKPRGATGLCIGRADVPVDRRKSKRLAHRIRRWARRRGVPQVVVTSPLRRAADVGRWLSAWGWQHRIDVRLSELDFGTWEGRPWRDIGQEPIDAWCADFERHAPGGGEPVADLLRRCAAVLGEPPACAVSHAGWISAALFLAAGHDDASAARWPSAVRYGSVTVLLNPCSNRAASASSPAGSACSIPTAHPGPCRPTS